MQKRRIVWVGAFAGAAYCVLPSGVQATGATEKVIHAFQAGNDGANPYGGLISDSAGNVYGTTDAGGSGCGCGTVFKLTKDREESVLHAFKSGSDGAGPYGALTLDHDHSSARATRPARTGLRLT